MARAALAIVLVAAATALGSSWAVAAPAAPEVSGRAVPGGAGVGAAGSTGGGPPSGPTGQGPSGARGGTDAGSGAAGSGAAGGGDGAAGGSDGAAGDASGAAAPTTEYARVPDCGANAPGGVLPESLCNNATLTCPEPGAVRYRLYARPAGQPGALWVQQGLQCLTAAELAAAGAAGPAAAAPVVVTLADFQRVPFAPGTSLLAPPGGQALVNLAVRVHAAAAVQVLPTVVQGAAVQVRATPVAYAWDFGDGAGTGPSSDPGAPWPAVGHEHAYTTPGPRAVTMSTTYAGEFSVAGGPWQPIEGQVTIASPAQPVLVRTARASLVGDLLG